MSVARPQHALKIELGAVPSYRSVAKKNLECGQSKAETTEMRQSGFELNFLAARIPFGDSLKFPWGTGAMESDWQALTTGREIAGYRIVRVLGTGGFGITYEAVNALERRFAV